MVDMTVKEFLLARIAEDEQTALHLLKDLEDQIAEERLGADERGPFTPTRMLSAQLWAHYDGQTRRRNFARGQQIASLADPARVLRECKAKRAIIEAHKKQEEEDDPSAWIVASETLLRSLALVYSDDPGYRQEWAPDAEG